MPTPPGESGAGPPAQIGLINAALRQVAQAESTIVDGSSGTRGAPGMRAAPIAPDAIPGYRLFREIHRGGQGVVFEGVQQSTGRAVAVKFSREGPFASASQAARFEREVQILAQLRHPHIVTIHDSGAVAGGAYLVMDYVAGRPLDQWAREDGPALPDVLRVFIATCEAVNAAHLRGVIHRDLKPHNVLIDEEDRPRVLDFGLAKRSGTEAGSSELTLSGQFVGSLPWASPEQAAGRSDEVDIRTDVYSLGVMLYQALTGRFPYDVVGSLRDVTDAILKVEPRPPQEHNRAIDRDLATIVLMCLRKERERRYQSAGALGRDLQRYLDGEPIEARRDSLGYLIRKQVERRRAAAAVATAFVTLFFVAFGVSLTYWRQAVVARDAAENQRVIAENKAVEAAAARDAETGQRRVAEREAERAEAVSAFLMDMLQAADPKRGNRADTPIRDVLLAAIERVEREEAFAEQPLTEAAVRAAIGLTLMELGMHAPARVQLERAYQLRVTELDAADQLVARSLAHLGQIARAEGDLVAAADYYDRALELYEAAGSAPTSNYRSLLNNYGLLLQQRGRFAEAEPILQRTLALDRELDPDNSLSLATSLNNLALVVRDLGRPDEAEVLWRECLDYLIDAFGEEHTHVAAVLESIASLRLKERDFEQAIVLQQRALDIRRVALGEDHPHYAAGLNGLGFVLFSAGEHEQAEVLYHEALARRRDTLGEEHPAVAMTLNNLALLYATQERYAEAEPLYREALAIKRVSYGPEHHSTLLSLSNLASLLRKVGRADEAEPLAREAVEVADATLPEGHDYRATFRSEWGACLLALERFDAAEPVLLDAYAALSAADLPDPERIARVAESLATLYAATGRDAEAGEWRARLAD